METNSTHRQRLTHTREDELLRYITALTDRHIPPTTQIITNLAEKLLDGPVGKNWIVRFIRRHSQRIYSRYLRPLNHKRISAESAVVFKHFYQLVLLLFS